MKKELFKQLIQSIKESGMPTHGPKGNPHKKKPKKMRVRNSKT